MCTSSSALSAWQGKPESRPNTLCAVQRATTISRATLCGVCCLLSLTLGGGVCVRQLTALCDALVSLVLHLMDAPTCLPVLALAYRLHDAPRQHTLCSAAREMAVRRFRDVNVDAAAHRASLATLPVTLLHRCACPAPVRSHVCPIPPTVSRPRAGWTAPARRFEGRERRRAAHSRIRSFVVPCHAARASAAHRPGELSGCGTQTPSARARLNFI